MKIRNIRMQLLVGVVVVAILVVAAGFWVWWLWTALLVLLPLIALGMRDLAQLRHSLLRNYPIIGHLRFLLEDTGPELRQYIVESNTEGAPFNRDMRSLMYQRAKDVIDTKPFGTELSVYESNYAWLAHCMAPVAHEPNPVESFRIDIGNAECTMPYKASVFNISAMSFGALSAAAITALNTGAAMGNFAHVTGEGGLSRYHREPGGDIIWQIGTGYFGCRADDGRFDPDAFGEQAMLEQVKMIEVKLSQGAKPGHGGILPGSKVNAEIAAARGVAIGQDCISPPYHTAFDSPIGLLEFVAKLRELSGGKPIGFKLCIGRPDEFFAVCKAMRTTGIVPDFITVDGAEGGTGAAPIEFSDHVGMPAREGICLVDNALRGVDLRDQVRVAAAGKLVTAFQIGAAMALGADWCAGARGFMFALGCIQAQACNTNECPVGVATQDPKFTKGLVVADKAQRVCNFHRNTVEALAEVIAAVGLHSPSELRPRHLFQRTSPTEIRSFEQLYSFYETGQLLDGNAGDLQPYWDAARAEAF
jgi:glutamate synthase domain-containing protein 2